MSTGFNFELVSPEQLLVSAEVAQVVVPGAEGYFTVLANHAPTMSTLNPGVAEVTDADGQIEKYVVFGGFVDVTPETCTLLVLPTSTAPIFNSAFRMPAKMWPMPRMMRPAPRRRPISIS